MNLRKSRNAMVFRKTVTSRNARVFSETVTFSQKVTSSRSLRARLGAFIASAAVLASAVLGAGSAAAHEVWIEPAGSGYQAVFGHPGERSVPAADRIRRLEAFGVDDRPLSVTRTPGADGLGLLVGGAPAVIVIDYDNGYWSRPPGATESINQPRTEVAGATSATHALKYGKVIGQWSAAASQPRGQRLELIPLQSTAPTVGSTLPVEVRWNGRPLAGARIVRVSPDQPAPLIGDDSGRVAVPVTRWEQILAVNVREPLAGDPGADTLAAAATLVFTVP